MNKIFLKKIKDNKDKVISGIIIGLIFIGILSLKINTDKMKAEHTINTTTTKQDKATNTQNENPYAKELSIIEDNTGSTFKGKSYSVSIKDANDDGKYEVFISLDAADNRFNETIWCGINGLGEIDGIKKYNSELDEKISSYNLEFYSNGTREYSAMLDNSNKSSIPEIKLTSAVTGENKVVTRQNIESYQASKKNETQASNEKTDNIPQTVTSSYKAKFGQVLEAKKIGGILTIKVKIESSLSDKLTIDKNGFNVEDLITNQGGNQFDTINYWAVSNMTDGTESKIISYTLNKDLIQKIKNKQVFGQQIASMADDVWILPSLKK